jgi:hypothetical protein
MSEIQSWKQTPLNNALELDSLSYWYIWDEDGLVDPGMLRQPVDGERYVVLLQAQERVVDIEW